MTFCDECKERFLASPYGKSGVIKLVPIKEEPKRCGPCGHLRSIHRSWGGCRKCGCTVTAKQERAMKKRDTEQTDLKRRIANLTPEQKKLMERGMVNAGVGKFMGLQAKGESRMNGYYLNLKKREPQSETVSSGEAWRGVEVISDINRGVLPSSGRVGTGRVE